ncbi:toxin [Desulfuromonas sp. CSMB_57]|uniref:toxin n=1 Tax=Desulfuromonas sp. CSMB_57 TaxID=2807629 RepID=UPI001CD3F50C
MDNNNLFEYFPTPAFSAKMDRIRKTDPHGYLRIRKTIHRLLENPATADGWMHGIHHGRLKKYVGRRDYRLIYHWCEQCRKTSRKLADRCGFCEEVHERSVIFFDIYHKNEQHELKHQQ